MVQKVKIIVTLVYQVIKLEGPRMYVKIHRFSVCDSNISIGVNPRVVVAPFARRHLWCICAAVSVGSQCAVARFARRYLWGICAAVSVGSQCVVARFARRHLWGICAAVSVGSHYIHTYIHTYIHPLCRV